MKEMVLSVAIADLLQRNAIYEGAANTPKFKKIITSAKTVGPAYEPPCREQVGGPLLDSLSLVYNKHAFERLGEQKYDHELAGASGGATAHHTSLVNFWPSLVVSLCLWKWWTARVTWLPAEPRMAHLSPTRCALSVIKIGANPFFLVIFDGASNMQSPAKPLVL
jgi:hypothetical protein